jgi:hypothetical protein
MTPMASVLRCALESALAVMDPAAFPDVAELTITLSNLTEATEIHTSMVWDDDARAYRLSTKVDTFPFILGDDLELEDDLTQHLEEDL